MTNSRFGFVAAVACMAFASAYSAVAQGDGAWLAARPGEKGSACDQAYPEPPFLDKDKTPVLASLKKQTIFGNTRLAKGYPLYILDIRDKRACVLVLLSSGPGHAWVDLSVIKQEPRTFGVADWQGRWQASGKLSVADNSHLPDWAQRLAPRETQGSEGEITISVSTEDAGTTVRIVGDKTILSARTGEKFSDRFEGTGRILGPMLIFDEARSANRTMTPGDCLVLMLIDAPGRIQVNSYGRCADNAVHDDGPYHRAPIAAKAN